MVGDDIVVAQWILVMGFVCLLFGDHIDVVTSGLWADFSGLLVFEVEDWGNC